MLMAAGLSGIPQRVSLLSRIQPAPWQSSRSVRKSAFIWPQVDQRFPFKDSFWCDNKRFSPEEVLSLLSPLVTAERLKSLDRVRLSSLPAEAVGLNRSSLISRLLPAGPLTSSLWSKVNQDNAATLPAESVTSFMSS